MGEGICDSLMAKMYIRSEADLHDAQAEIARLKAEVERLTRDSYSKEWAELRFIAAWNDAIEAAAGVIAKGGLHTINDRVEAIRALKRPVS